MTKPQSCYSAALFCRWETIEKLQYLRNKTLILLWGDKTRLDTSRVFSETQFPVQNAAHI